MNCAISPATEAPLRHDLSNHSGAELPMKLNKSTCAAEKERETLKGEFSTSNIASLGLGSEVRQVDFPTDESGGSSEATNRVESVWSKEEAITEKDQNNDASGNVTVHRNEVSSQLSDESTRGILGPSAEKNPPEPPTTAAFEPPKEVSTVTKGHYVGPMSPMTPDSCTPRPSDEFNSTMDLGPAVSEAIAGLSPITARESDYHMIERIPLESHVVRNDSKGNASPVLQLKKTNADGLQSQESSSQSDQDHALANNLSLQTSEDEDVDTTEVSSEATEPCRMNDSQNICVLGTCLAMIDISDEVEPKGIGESSPFGDTESQHKSEHVATHFEDEKEAGTPNLEYIIEAAAHSLKANTSKEEQALTDDQSRQAEENGDTDATKPYEMDDPQDDRAETSLETINISIETEKTRMSSSNSIGEIDSHSELAQSGAYFKKLSEIGTAGPDVVSVRASIISEEGETNKLFTSTLIGDTVSHPEREQIAAHFGEERDTGTIDPEAGYEADIYSSPASNTLEEGEAKRLGSVNHSKSLRAALHFEEGHETGASNPEDSHKAGVVSWQASKRLSSCSSIGGKENHSEREQAAVFFRIKQEADPSNPESSLEADGVALNVERTVELESSLTPRRHIDSPNPSKLSNRDSFDPGKNDGTERKSSRAYKDLTSAKKHLDASSLAFIERLRGAAHRRKLQVARSRDVLVAKEREQLLSIASAKEQQLSVALDLPSTLQPAHDRFKISVGPYKPFKARPAPNTTGHFGSGGQVGVPKVQKKPATTPFSPLLGARRPKKEGTSFIDQTLREPCNRMESKPLPFKARPAPPTTGYLGHGGQAGVPKIPKLPATVPESPLLGKKRSSFATAVGGGMDLSCHRDKTASNFPSKRDVTKAGPFVRLFSGSEASTRKETPHRERQQRETVKEQNSRALRARPLPVSVTSSAASPSPLLGLQILNTQKTPTRMDLNDIENMEPHVTTPQKPHLGIVPYEPHSTVRAKKRALFDEIRASNEIIRQEEQQRIRQSVIEQEKKELIKLRDSLR